MPSSNLENGRGTAKTSLVKGRRLGGLRRLRTWTKAAGKRSDLTTGEWLHVGEGTCRWATDHLRIGRDVCIGKDVSIECNREMGDLVLIAGHVGIVAPPDHESRTLEVSVCLAHRMPMLAPRPEIIDWAEWIGVGATVLGGCSEALVGERFPPTRRIAHEAMAVTSESRVSERSPARWSLRLGKRP